MKSIKEIEYEIRAIDAVMDEEGCWMWNNSIPVNNFKVRETAKNHKGAFLRHLKSSELFFLMALIRLKMMERFLKL